VRIEVVGERELREALERQGDAGRIAAVSALRRVAARVPSQARALAPDDPETEPKDLAASIRISKPRVNRRTGQVSVGVVAGGAPVRRRGQLRPYAVVQEKGFAGIGPGGAFVSLEHPHGGESPYLWPPFERESREAPEELMKDLDAQMKAAVR
jgi:hypothetical protein